VAKQESKHKHPDIELYRRAPVIIEHGFVRIEPPRHAIYILHEETEKRRSYKAVVKATRDGRELFLVSLHRVDRTDVRAVYRRTISLDDWEKGVREVGPPKNPT
jgi:hypothetical protein